MKRYFGCTILLVVLILDAASAKGPFHGQLGVAIEQSFGTGNPRFLKPYLPRKGKIYLSIPAANVSGGYFSRDQIISILDRMFRHVITRGFNLHGGRLPHIGRSPVRSTWRFTDKNTNKLITTTIYFTITANPLKPVIKAIRGEKI